MAERIFSLQRLLTPIRLRYPWFIGSALWLAWLLSILIGRFSGDNTDPFGQLVGTDFAAFYTAGEIVRNGQSSRLYDPTLAIDIQTRLYGFESQNFNPYLNPPFYAWMFVPFSTLPYPTSPVIWMALNLVFLFFAIKILGVYKTWPIFLLTLTWIPAWSVISFGQNTFLSLLILSLALLFWQKQRHFVAGLIFGLLFYKPQLMIGVIFLWILFWRQSWNSLLGCLITGSLLFGSSYIWMPEATQAYFAYAQSISSSLMTHPAFPIWNAHGTFTFWLGIFPSWPLLGKTLYLVTTGLISVFFIKFIYSEQRPFPVKFGAAVLFTVWTTPYLMVYDWAILIIPAIVLWHEYPEYKNEWKVIYSILWVVMLFSGSLTALQWNTLGWATQISVPTLALITYLSNFLLKKGKNNNTAYSSSMDPISAG